MSGSVFNIDNGGLCVAAAVYAVIGCAWFLVAFCRPKRLRWWLACVSIALTAVEIGWGWAKDGAYPGHVQWTLAALSLATVAAAGQLTREDTQGDHDGEVWI